jgi:rod shape-determining protein MreD
MLWRQALLIGTLVVAAVVIEVTLLSRLGLPGATPDLVVVTVVAIALAMGSVPGAVAGFAAGVLIDVAPPADSLLGVNALIYLAIGYIAGRVVDPRDRTMLVLVGMVALSAGAATVLVAAMDTVLGGGRVAWDAIPTMVLTTALYAALLAPVMIVAVGWLARRITPEVAVI